MTLNNNRQAPPAPDADVSARLDQRLTEPPGEPAPAGAAADNPPASDPSNVARAEQIADRLAEKCAAVTSACVRQLAWLTARTREAAQDLWAEAQSVRHKDNR